MTDPISAAVGAALRADMPAALTILHELDEDALPHADRESRRCLLERFDRPEPPPFEDPTGDELADRLLRIFRDYWWRALTTPANAERLAGKLHTEVQETLGVRAETIDALERAGLDALRTRGFHGLMGVTSPLRELMLWRSQDRRTYDVELPEGRQTTRVDLLDDFVSFGWAHYATCGRRATGGWATDEGLFAVVPRYPDGVDGETFRVTFLGHESQHFADFARFGELPQWVLEYRAKLVELALADTTRPAVLGKFTESQSDDPAIPHAYANRRALEAVREALGEAPDRRDLLEVPADQLRQAAIAALHADTASRPAR